jgi:alkylation response protein AidB-like acyl-CoA dehydrogenase
MNFAPTDEQRMMIDACRRMVDREVRPVMDAHPADRPLPKDAVQSILRSLARLGLTAARLPVEAGGSGMGALDYGLMCEQIPPVIVFLLLPQETTITRIHHGCSPQQRDALLPKLIAADLVTCTAATEPDVGSDPRGIRTRVRDDGEALVLNGRKMWIENATIADVVNVTCVDESGRLGRVLVDRRESKFEASEIRMMGLRQCALGEIAFDGCRVPRANKLGSGGDAARVLTLTWLANRPIIGLCAVNLAQAAFDAAREYALVRRQFGQPIGAFQLVQERLADIETAIVTSRLACYHALAAIDRGERANGPSAMAKRYAVDACERAIRLAMQLHGAMGVSEELGLEQMARDVRMLAIPDGTPEILALIQGREITGLDAFRPEAVAH